MDDAVYAVCDRVARRRILRYRVAQAVGQVFYYDILASSQFEAAAVMDDEVGLKLFAVCRISAVGIVIENGLARAVVEADFKVEFLCGVVLAHDRLADSELGGLLLDVHARYRRECKVHVAGRARGSSLGVEEGERMCACLAHFEVVPKVDILADGRVNAADIANELVVKEHPHIVVAEEVVLQRALIVCGEREAYGILHAEEAVVVSSVVAVRQGLAFFRPFSAYVVCAGKALIIHGIRIRAEHRVGLVCRRIKGPEIICKYVRVGLVRLGRRIVELLKSAYRADSVYICRRKRVGIADLVEGKAAALIGVLAGCRAVVEQLRCNDPVVVYYIAVGKALGKAEGTAVVDAAVFIEIYSVKFVVCHAGAAVCVAEGNNISVIGPLCICVGSVVSLLVYACCAGQPFAVGLTAGDIIVIERTRCRKGRLMAGIYKSDARVIGDVDNVIPRRFAPVGEVNVARIVYLPVCLIRA